MAELSGEDTAGLVVETLTEPGGTPVIVLGGEVDSANVGVLAVAVEAVTATRPGRLVFDMGALRFIDSAGIAVLVGAAARVGTVYLRNASPITRRVVTASGLAEVLHIEP